MNAENRAILWCIVGFSLLAGGIALDHVPAVGAAFFITAGLALGFRVGFEIGRRFS